MESSGEEHKNRSRKKKDRPETKTETKLVQMETLSTVLPRLEGTSARLPPMDELYSRLTSTAA
jgi:hypothetical protein